jgi:hypothetical protein
MTVTPYVSKLETLTRDRRRTVPDSDEINDDLVSETRCLFARAEIEAAGNVVDYKRGESGHAVLAWERRDHWIEVRLFDWMGDSVDGDSRYAWIAESSGCVAFTEDDEATSELRHLYIGDDDPEAPGYLYLPDLDMLQWFLRTLAEIYAQAKRQAFGGAVS